MKSTPLPRPEGWPTLPEGALYGLAGDVVKTILPHTESDPAALLLTFLVGFGNAIGPGPYIVADGARHTAVEFVQVVGDTSRARKGSSLSHIRSVLDAADPDWEQRRVGGLASGEGVMARLAHEDNTDPRLFVVEPELARLLTAGNREGSILSAVIRDLWDGTPLDHLTKHDPIKVDHHHVSILAHITVDELRDKLRKVDVANGFANRFLVALVTRSKLLPHGGNLDDMDYRRLGVHTARALATAKGFGRIRRSLQADYLWERMYAALAVAPSGPAGKLTARAEAHLLRLSLLYALIDGSDTIEVDHLAAAWELYRYCHQSVLEMVDGSQVDVEQRLLDAVRSAGDAGMSATEQRDLFQRHESGERLHQARHYLEHHGLAVSSKVQTGGRPTTVTVATSDQSDTSDLSDLPTIASLWSQGSEVAA